MKSQIKKAKKLQKRCENINQLFQDVETKQNYCNLKAYARNMLQPMLNLQQEFVKQKVQRVYGTSNIISLPWQTQELSNEDSNLESLENSFSVQQEQQNDTEKKKANMSFKKTINFSLNEVIQKEEIQNQNQQEEESFDEKDCQITDMLEEHRGCSMKQSTKEVQQKVTFYEKDVKKNLKTLPKLIEENNLIKRITSLNLLTQELKKARGESKQRIQKYLIEDYIDYLKRKQEDQVNEANSQLQNDSIISNSKSQSHYQNILPEIFSQKKSPSKVSNSSSPNKKNKNQKHIIDIDDEDNPFQDYFLPKIQQQQGQNDISNTHAQNQFVNATMQEKQRKHIRSQSEENQNTLHNDKDETTINSQNGCNYLHSKNLLKKSEKSGDYGISLTSENEHEKIQLKNEQDLIDQLNGYQKKTFNFEKMNKIFQLKRVINPAKLNSKITDIEKNRQGISPINSINKQEFKLYMQKSLSHNSSQQNLIGSTANNSYITNLSRDQIKTNSNSYNSNSQFLWSNRKNFINSSGALGSVNQSVLYLNKSTILPKKFNLPKEFPVPDFVKKIKNLILEVESQGDQPLTGDQTIELANILSLISMQKEAINYTGKTVADYQFNMKKEHFIVPQKSRDIQLNVNKNSSPVYGSIAMLDKIYQINLPSLYILQGPGKDMDKIK